MNQTQHNSIVNFIWRIADDVLRDRVVSSKYRDIILPMTVIRRLDGLLEPTKDAVLQTHQWMEQQKIYQQDAGLKKTAGFPFYNTSKFTLRRLLDEPSQIRANFENYLDGFSANVREIIRNFSLRAYLEKLNEDGALYRLVSEFVSPQINFSPEPVQNAHGEVVREGLSNLGMGYVFEELLRRFNAENNEEAGQYFTPRDVVRLMADLVVVPVKDQLKSGTYLVYDCACGSGGMLTEAEARLDELAEASGLQLRVELFGQETVDEIFAVCQADMLIKGRDPENIKFGSTLSKDGFPSLRFDFMLANPPFGTSWKKDADALAEGKKKDIKDSRFLVEHSGLPVGEKLALLPRVSDGQLLFTVHMLQKMKHDTPLGSRIAVVHNGSSLFTGDAGQGESNARRWIIENDWLEAIIGLPLDMFYNTGIAAYIWVLSNRKGPHRKGKIQLIDATDMYRKLRSNLGKKNCELTAEHIRRITDLYLRFEGAEESYSLNETRCSKIFDNDDFGYHKITVERPLRLGFQITPERESAYNGLWLNDLKEVFGTALHRDFNCVKLRWEEHLKRKGLTVKIAEQKAIWAAFTTKDEKGEPVIRKESRLGVEYESDPELRDTESVPLKERIEDFFEREVRPYVRDAWIDHEKTQRGYEISFAKYFYKSTPLRSLDEIAADIFAMERETEGLLHEIVRATVGAK